MRKPSRNRPARRPLIERRPLVEALERRELLSTTTLDFNGGAGGVANTGFASMLPTSYGKGLLTGNLSLSNGKLNVVTTAGDMWGTRNTQDNALDLPLNATGDFTVQARLTSLPFTKNWQNGGIFVGTNQDNYVKIVAGYNNGTGLQLGTEANASATTAALSSFSFAGVTSLDLRLVGTASTRTVVAQYRANSTSDTAWVTLGQVTNANVFSTASAAGIVTTSFYATPVSVAYESFSVTGPDAVVQPPPPPPPTGSSQLSVATNVNASKLSGNQLETEIAYNPTNPNNVVIVAQNQNNNSANLLISRSFDGGKTWAQTSIGSAQDKLSGSTPRVDPHVTFDAFGNAYVAYMVASSSSELRIIVARSSDGGGSWTAQTAVSGLGLGPDFPFIATGPDATNLSRQTVWVGVTDDNARRVKIVAARSTGLGNLGAFSAPQTVGDASGSFGSVAVGPLGQVAVAWQTAIDRQGNAKVMVDVDPDGLGTARTWGKDVLASATQVGGFDYIPAQPDRSVDANVRVEFDRAPSSPTKGRLYLLYADEIVNESNNLDVMLRYSDTLGATWSSALRVNDDTTTRSQFLPVMSVDQTTGNVAIVWHDARNDPNNRRAEIWGTVSLDHGKSVLKNVRISAGSSIESGADGYPDDLDFGDYAGVSFQNGRFIAVWADNSNSTFDNPNGANNKFDLYTAVVTLL